MKTCFDESRACNDGKNGQTEKVFSLHGDSIQMQTVEIKQNRSRLGRGLLYLNFDNEQLMFVW
jgi:hypothetical protein